MQAGMDKYGMVSVAVKRKQGNLANLRFVPLSKKSNNRASMIISVKLTIS